VGYFHNTKSNKMSVRPETPEFDCLRRLLVLARAEDLGRAGDVTSSIVPEGTQAVAAFVAREDLVFCGGALLATIAAEYDENLRTEPAVDEGALAASGRPLATWRGPARSILAAERVALNFLQKLSGVATATRRFVEAVESTPAEIYDTRKTTPGWRELEKYAVRAGGGKNHRMGLFDAALIKDNHLAALAGTGGQDPMRLLPQHLERLRRCMPDGAFIELEVDTLDQLDKALSLPVDIIMLDNFSADDLRAAVKARDDAGLAGKVAFEASGGITLATVRQVAETGVERIAVGAVTHSAPAVDIALEMEVQ